MASAEHLVFSLEQMNMIFTTQEHLCCRNLKQEGRMHVYCCRGHAHVLWSDQTEGN